MLEIFIYDHGRLYKFCRLYKTYFRKLYLLFRRNFINYKSRIQIYLDMIYIFNIINKNDIT